MSGLAVISIMSTHFLKVLGKFCLVLVNGRGTIFSDAQLIIWQEKKLHSLRLWSG
ncbi:hypothetical protein HMPREF1557_01192 [Streptococcus sobrinus W1703]|uniref:Uncharacterized protein n=1 Tax=Streptococcus sobrinus W1703 TaxID=1227275 RepID=U2J8Q0_9STRE|nr:hypothetical protein HMPREF1557_01192 [Streptococcus sobrinus W1703]